MQSGNDRNSSFKLKLDDENGRSTNVIEYTELKKKKMAKVGKTSHLPDVP